MPKVLRTGNVALLPLAGLLAVLACADGSSAPAVATPDEVSFGDVDVGGSAARNVTLTNTSTTPLDIVDVITSGEGVTVSGHALPITIAPGETMNLGVELAPTTSGDVSGSVSFLAATGTDALARVRTIGRGVRPNTLLIPAPVSVSFGDVAVGTRVTQDVTVTNTDNRDLRVASLSASAAGVTATGLPLPATFAPGESATFTVAFAPTAAGAVSGSVALKNDYGRSLAVVESTGTAVSPTVPVALSAAPSRLDFANVTVGSFSAQGVTLTNPSSQAVTVSEVATTGAGFSVSGLSLPATIAPGGTAQVSVKFTPSTTGSVTGQLAVRSSGATWPLAAVQLAGSAVAAASVTSVTVRDATVEAGKTVQLQADVVAVGTIDKSVTWSVDSASLGTVDAKSGLYTAPAAPGTYQVSAVSNADSSKKGTGSVTVTAPPPTTTPTDPTPTPTLPPGVVPAFPGAEGSAAVAKGGRGGAVIFVTNLNNSGAGSLRACVEASGPRTCVFRVGGTIQLTATLYVTNPYLTVAGQTAPGGGIAISGKLMTTGGTLVQVNTHDVVWRYTRIRYGNSGAGGNAGANICIYNPSYNVIFDHNSITWGMDDMACSYTNTVGVAPHDLTYSWNLAGEGLHVLQNGTIVSQSTPLSAYASTTAAADVSTNIDFHKNFVSTYNHRGPLLGVKSVRWVNNLTYNWNYWPMMAYGGSQVDIVSNVWKAGPRGAVAAYRYEVYGAPGSGIINGPTGTLSLYVKGNIGPHNTDPASDNWTAMVHQTSAVYGGSDIGVLGTTYRRTTPLASAGIPITVADVGNLEAQMLPDVGASRRLDCSGNWVANRDASDARMVNNYRAGTGSIPADENDVGGFPFLSAGTACADGDNDGMPDAWESAQRLNPADASDRNAYAAGSMYTNLERYLAGN